MQTLRQFAAKPDTIPLTTAWYLADLGEARGRQELFTKQSPQGLRVLREHGRIERAGGRYHGKRGTISETGQE